MAKGTPIDRHAAHETTTVYAGVRTFPMLPERLSTDLTSLNENQDRAAVVIEMLVAADGVDRRRQRLSGAGAQPRATDLQRRGAVAGRQGRRAAESGRVAPICRRNSSCRTKPPRRCARRAHRLGALTFDRVEAQAGDRRRQGAGRQRRARSNRAAHLIEDFMIAANEVMARTLRAAGVSSIRRVVKAPERWPRIVELAAQLRRQAAARARFRRAERLPDAPQAGRPGALSPMFRWRC